MNRRDALKNTFLLVGGTTISASAIATMMTSCQTGPDIGFTPTFLTEAEAQTLTAAVDVLIPKTDTPGAVEAGVSQLIDLLATNIFTEEDQKRLQDGIAQMNADSQEKFGSDFASASVEQQTELLTEYDQQVFGPDADRNGERPFFGDFKQLVVSGFCESELGATQHLQYEAVPGDYSGCVPIEEVGRGVAWAEG